MKEDNSDIATHADLRAISITREIAKLFKPSYYVEPFQPHAWVVSAATHAFLEGVEFGRMQIGSAQIMTAVEKNLLLEARSIVAYSASGMTHSLLVTNQAKAVLLKLDDVIKSL